MNEQFGTSSHTPRAALPVVRRPAGPAKTDSQCCDVAAASAGCPGLLVALPLQLPCLDNAALLSRRNDLGEEGVAVRIARENSSS